MKTKTIKSLNEVKKLVTKYGLSDVSVSITRLKEERKAERELKIAEAKVAEMKRKLNK